MSGAADDPKSDDRCLTCKCIGNGSEHCSFRKLVSDGAVCSGLRINQVGREFVAILANQDCGQSVRSRAGLGVPSRAKPAGWMPAVAPGWTCLVALRQRSPASLKYPDAQTTRLHHNSTYPFANTNGQLPRQALHVLYFLNPTRTTPLSRTPQLPSTMADRFPSLDDFDSGGRTCCQLKYIASH